MPAKDCQAGSASVGGGWSSGAKPVKGHGHPVGELAEEAQRADRRRDVAGESGGQEVAGPFERGHVLVNDRRASRGSLRGSAWGPA